MRTAAFTNALALGALAAVMLGPGEPGCSPTVPTACGEMVCADRECGPSPTCEGSCGTCLDGEVCNADGLCEVETVCEPGYADCVDGMTEVCLEDGSAWFEPQACDPNSSPRFTFDYGGENATCDDRDCVSLAAGETHELTAVVWNRDPYRTIAVEVQVQPVDLGRPIAPNAWFSVTEPFLEIPWLNLGMTTVFVSVPQDAVPDIYVTMLQARLENYSFGGGSVVFHLAVGRTLRVEVL